MSDIFKTNLEALKQSVNRHVKIFREQLDESEAKLVEHHVMYGDYYYRTDDDPPKTTELVMQSSLKDLKSQIESALKIIELVDKINKNAKDSGSLPKSSDEPSESFDPEKWLKENDSKTPNQDEE